MKDIQILKSSSSPPSSFIHLSVNNVERKKKEKFVHMDFDFFCCTFHVHHTSSYTVLVCVCVCLIHFNEIIFSAYLF